MNDAVWVDIAQAAENGSSRPSQSAGELPPSPIATATVAGDVPRRSRSPGWAGKSEDVAFAPFLFHDALGAVVAPPVGRNRRISSNEQPRWNDANLDMNWLQPGQVLELPVLTGPGRHQPHVVHQPRRVGQRTERLEHSHLLGRPHRAGRGSAAGRFLRGGAGQAGCGGERAGPGVAHRFADLLLADAVRRVRPDRDHERQSGPRRGTVLAGRLGAAGSLPPDTPYFHAQYRQEYPAAAGQDYTIADLAGCGQFVGTVMSVTLAQDGWFGEGDDFFYIDGEEVPSLQGTGSEDYFNDAWGFRPRTGPWFGQPRWQGDRAGDSGVCYRWHVLDPVGFTKSLRVTIEHKGNYDDDLAGFYVERPEFVSSVAFWYQTGTPKRFAELPPWQQRRVPWQQQHLVRTFLAGGVDRRGQGRGADAGVLRRTSVAVLAECRNRGPLDSAVYRGRGRELRCAIDSSAGPAIRAVRHSHRRPARGGRGLPGDSRCRTGSAGLRLSAVQGTHTVIFQALDVAATGEQPTARPLAVEMLRLLQLPPPARREVKTHHEAHFVRLGIGRALYAYRLAYGKLPDSLETLVEVGIMPARYLKDENELPLKFRREGDFMVVESPAPNGWKHRWQGLDPRR